MNNPFAASALSGLLSNFLCHACPPAIFRFATTRGHRWIGNHTSRIRSTPRWHSFRTPRRSPSCSNLSPS